MACNNAKIMMIFWASNTCCCLFDRMALFTNHAVYVNYKLMNVKVSPAYRV